MEPILLTEDKNDVKDDNQLINKQPHQDKHKTAEKNVTARSHKHTAHRLEKVNESPARLEPTRYGDWEKNGRCIDF